MMISKFKIDVFNELTHEDINEEFKLKKRYFDIYHSRILNTEKFAIFNKDKIKIISETQLHKLYKSTIVAFTLRWVCCVDVRIVKNLCLPLDTKNRDACARWRANNADKWCNLNKLRAQTQRDLTKHRTKMESVFFELKENN